MWLEMLWEIIQIHFYLATTLLQKLHPPFKLNSVLITVIITMGNSIAVFTSGPQSAW